MIRKKIIVALAAAFTGLITLSSCQTGYDETAWLELFPLAQGEELAVLHTNYGKITLRFFPEKAPMAVENFVTHAKNGYYDGVVFHRVIDGFMIQGGDPKGDGTGGESIWGGSFGYEFDYSLRHYRGALAMAHSELPASNGSQFYIVQNKGLHPNVIQTLNDLKKRQDEPFTEVDGKTVYISDLMPPEAADAYKAGGTPHLDIWYKTYTGEDPNSAHTVFGHVVRGMKVVDAIAAVEVVDASRQNYKPAKEVVIKKITFETAR